MTKTTPGAMRAAKEIKSQLLTMKEEDGMLGEIDTNLQTLAEIIDGETASPAMLEALIAERDANDDESWQKAKEMARAAIAAATGEGKIG